MRGGGERNVSSAAPTFVSPAVGALKRACTVTTKVVTSETGSGWEALQVDFGAIARRFFSASLAAGSDQPIGGAVCSVKSCVTTLCPLRDALSQ